MGGTAVVVGGGIGGLSAALALRRAGWTVTVLERAPRFEPVGAGIALMANALRGLDELGVGPAVRAEGRVDASGGIRRWDGRWLTRVDGAEMARVLGTAALGIHRATLHRILADALPGNALVAGAEVVGVTAGPPPEVTWLRDGERCTVRADLVVGADGIHSVLRSRLWPQLPPPVYAGATAWRGVTRRRWDGELLVAASWGPGAEFGMVPLGDGRIYWYGAVNAPAGQRFPDEMAAVRARFGSWHPPIPALLDATDADSVLRNDIHHLATPLPGYVRGGVALLGDAAHAMTPYLGQGAGQAIEDAVVLGRAVTDWAGGQQPSGPASGLQPSSPAGSSQPSGPTGVATALAWYDA
ncbi:MAG TPA: FAD-dependent oxidoreductase, partial [Micromonospora sp.]